MISLSGCDIHLEADAKVLTTSSMCLIYFIQKCPLKSYPIEQFPSILEIGSYIWRLLQAVSKAGWDCFKILPQPDAPTLMKAMKTVYGPVPIPTPFFFQSSIYYSVQSQFIADYVLQVVYNFILGD